MFNGGESHGKEAVNSFILLPLIVTFFAIPAFSQALLMRANQNNVLPHNWVSDDFYINRCTWEQNIEYAGSCMWSHVTDVFITGTDVWASFNNGLCHIDISDVSNPAVVSELYIPCGYKGITGKNDIIVDGNYAYIGDKDGLRTIDISSMELVSTYPLQRAHSLFLCGAVLYVADGTGMKVFDVTNPAVPDSVGFFPIPGAVGIDAVGNYAYISDTGNKGLTILDITVPEIPVFVSDYQTSGYGNDVIISNGHAIIADHTNGLEIVDVTVPSNPVFKSHIQTSGPAYGVKAAGNYVFVAADDMDVIDISNISAPFIAQTFSTMDDVRSVFLSGDYLVSSEGSFLEILNIQQPASTYLEGSLERPYWLQEVSIDGNIAYIADMGEFCLVPGGLKIIDISNPENPLPRGEYEMGLFALPNNLDVKYNYAYMQDYISSTSTLIALDVSNPDSPQLAGEYGYSAKDIFAGTSYVYILDDDDLVILDLQDPLNPVEMGALALGNSALRVCVSNGYAFVAGDGENTLWIVDVSNSSNPQLITSITTACNYARDIVVQDDLVYLVCSQCMQIIDITNISSPVIISTYDDVTSATGICVCDSIAYIADYNLLKIDVSDPEVPSAIQSYGSGSHPYRTLRSDSIRFREM